MIELETLGRVMAIDLGDKQIGIALSDPTRSLARGHLVFARKSRKEDFARYQTIITEKGVTLVVVGLPTHLDGAESKQSAWVRDYSAEFFAQIAIPLVFEAQHHTTNLARATMVARGQSRRSRQAQKDAVAAAHILQRYLDSSNPEREFFFEDFEEIDVDRRKKSAV